MSESDTEQSKVLQMQNENFKQNSHGSESQKLSSINQITRNSRKRVLCPHMQLGHETQRIKQPEASESSLRETPRGSGNLDVCLETTEAFANCRCGLNFLTCLLQILPMTII